MKKNYTVQELAKLAGVSVRTLHYYDSIALLSPSARSEAGYRLYGENELYRLQQILFYKELDVSLKNIQQILDDPKFDLVNALEKHKLALLDKCKRLDGLVLTIDKTLSRIKGEEEMVTDKDLYCEFSKETLAEYKDYMAKNYDPEIMKEAEQNVKKMTKKQWQETNKEGQKIAEDLAEKMELATDSTDVQRLIARHHRWVENFYQANANTYRCLGQMYVDNPNLKKYYENFKPGLAAFLAEAMSIYSDNNLD